MTNESSARLDRLVGWYGDGRDGAAPTLSQWQRLLDHPAGTPVTFVNFFALRAEAVYEPPDGRPEEPRAPEEPCTGEEAFARYAEVSVPTVDKVGASFVSFGPAVGAFAGPEVAWDLIAVVAYPDAEAALALYEDAAYRAAFAHRRAAVADQAVVLSAG